MRLSASGLACLRGMRAIFTDIGFELQAGQALAVVGPNGAGKSSLLRLIAGLLPASAGQIDLLGGDSDLTVAEQAHYQGHLDAFKASLTVAENLAFWISYLGGARRPEEALAATGLEDLASLPAGYLSAGQRRRLSLARLVAVWRPIWLLDEPGSALDAAGQARLTELIRDHLAGGGMIVAATHAPLGVECETLQLGLSAPSPLEGEGWGGGSSGVPGTVTLTPNPSPQVGGEQSRAPDQS